MIFVTALQGLSFGQDCSCFFSIGFEDQFISDKVSLSVNDKVIFKDLLLSHNLSTGHTDMDAIFTKKNDSTFIISNSFSNASHYMRGTLFLKSNWKEQISLEVKVNRKVFIQEIDVSNGCYITVSYDRRNKNIKISQSHDIKVSD